MESLGLKNRPPKLVGTHKGCGGRVTYTCQGALSWLYCDKCHQSTAQGDSLEVEKI